MKKRFPSSATADRSAESTPTGQVPRGIAPGLLWLPLLSPGVPLLGYYALQAGIDWSAISSVLKAPPRGSVNAVAVQAAHAHYGGAILCTGTVAVALIVVSLGSLRSSGWIRAAFLGGIGASGAVLSLWLVGSFPLIRLEVDYLQTHAHVDTKTALLLQLCLVGGTCPIVAMALVGGATRLWKARRAPPERLVRVASHTAALTRALLALTAVWLVLGIVGEELFHRLVAATMAEEAVSAMAEIGRAATVLRGAFLTLALATAFGSAELLVHAGMDHFEHPEIMAWREENSFGSTLVGALGRVLAVLAPLIASIIGSTIDL